MAKRGVAAGGGTPREFTTITVTDGIAMGHAGMKASLVSREVIADSIELTMRGHCYDALVGFAGCDKSLPGVMMAMVRLNVPAVFMYGGSILPGRFRGRDVTVQDVFEAVGAHSAGKMSDEDLHELECVACPSAGLVRRPVHRQHHGLRLRGDRARAAGLGRLAGALRLRATPMPRPRATPSWSCSAATSARATSSRARRSRMPRTIVAASGGSTNGGLHLPAIAHEGGIDFDLHDVAEVFKRTPYIADLKPGGRYVAKDLYEVGGVPVLMKALLDGGYLHGDCITVTGKTIAENLRGREIPREPGRGASDLGAAVADRRRRRAQGQSRAAGRDREGRRHGEPASSAARRAASTARRTPSPASSSASTRRARCW